MPRKRSSSVVLNFVRAREIDRVRDDEEVVLVVLDLRQRAGRDAVLDGERVKLEDALEDALDFLVGGVVEVDPEEEALVGAHEPQRLALEVLADELAVAEDEGADHRADVLVGICSGHLTIAMRSGHPASLPRRRSRR